VVVFKGTGNMQANAYEQSGLLTFAKITLEAVNGDYVQAWRRENACMWHLYQ
jgi:hypothetical protein